MRYEEISKNQIMTKEDLRKLSVLFLKNNKLDKRKDEIVIKYTSGSTGIPLIIPQKKIDNLNQIRNIWKFREKYNINPKSKSIMFHLNSENVETKTNGFIIKGNKFIINKNYLHLFRNNIIKELKIFKPEYIIAPPSCVVDLLYELLGEEIIQTIKYIELISEPLYNFQIRIFEKYFDSTKIVNQYGCTEVTVIGIDENLEGKFNIFDENVYVETKYNNHIGKNYNHEGNVLITCYNSSLIPIVRYDTGDLGMLIQDIDGNEKLVLTTGRLNDYIYISKQKKIHSSSICKIIEHRNISRFVEKFKFIQNDYKSILLLVSLNKGTTAIDFDKSIRSIISDTVFKNLKWNIVVLDKKFIDNEKKMKYFECNIKELVNETPVIDNRLR